jgi:glutamate/tyrosine decarboxylase-like PLP-dependent enzyme
MDTIQQLFTYSFNAQKRFRRQWESIKNHSDLDIDIPQALEILQQLEEKLKDNYPFFHPRYAGQMLKPPHPIAMAAYLMAMQINPNNHALDGGPATAKLEFAVVKQIAEMFGYSEHLGHLTSSGTIANLEALWIAKSLHPEKKIAFSKNAHYTHHRMCEVIGAQYVTLESFENLESDIKKHEIGTIVVTIGTTSLGEIEPLENIVPTAQSLKVRVHVDAAYGGFFMLLANQKKCLVRKDPFLAIKEADSIVVDPHKHGLQPYGCGCILFRDPSVGKFYKHDSPYTYFTSKNLHLGEISLECSRPGAAAAALWATLQYLPLQSDAGLGIMLTKTRTAALKFSKLLAGSTAFLEFALPDLDIVTYFPKTKMFNASQTSTKVQRIFESTMENPKHPLYLAALTVESSMIKKLYSDFIADEPTTKILRSVLMKPEHLDFVPQIFSELEQIAIKHL